MKFALIAAFLGLLCESKGTQYTEYRRQEVNYAPVHSKGAVQTTYQPSYSGKQSNVQYTPTYSKGHQYVVPSKGKSAPVVIHSKERVPMASKTQQAPVHYGKGEHISNVYHVPTHNGYSANPSVRSLKKMKGGYFTQSKKSAPIVTKAVPVVTKTAIPVVDSKSYGYGYPTVGYGYGYPHSGYGYGNYYNGHGYGGYYGHYF